MAQKEIYQRHVRGIYRAVRSLCWTDADAEDIVHETFIRAFTRIDRYKKIDTKEFRSWLVTIALNEARNRRKKNLRRKAIDIRMSQDFCVDMGSLEKRVEAKEQLDRVRSYWRGFSQRDQEILALRFGAEMNATEISRIKNVSPALVRKVCERARKEVER